MQQQTTKLHKTAGTFLLRCDPGTTDWHIYLIYYNRTQKLFWWSSAKWHIENWENIEEAAIRETKEETGYQNFQIIWNLGCNKYEYSDDNWCMHRKETYWFCAKLISDERSSLKLTWDENSSRTKDWWFPLDQAENLLRFDDEKVLLKKIKDVITNDI